MRNPDSMAFFHWGLEKMLSATLANPTLFWGVVGFAGAAVATIGLKVLKYITADADMTLLSHQKIPNDGFKGKITWITGASSGIGKELAIEMAKRQATLVLSARRRDELELVAARCRDAGAQDVMVLPMDVLDFDSHKKLVDQILARYKRIDILVNNAGRSQRSLVEDSDIAVDRDLMTLNVLAPMSITKAVLPSMIAAKSGHVVVTSSVAGKGPAPCGATYSATKHACQGFFDTLRMEVADRNINVTMVCPGPVVSEILDHAFTGTSGKELNMKMKNLDGYVATNRCGFLMACAIYHKLDEVWISKQPILSFLYVNQYFPTLGKALGRKIGPKRVANFRAGIMEHDFSGKDKKKSD